MLKGRSGIGKTKLLLEVRRIACLKRAIFGSAKFDQFKRGLPFSAYISILRSLVNVRISSGPRPDVVANPIAFREDCHEMEEACE
jgi:predicted ATPase